MAESDELRFGSLGETCVHLCVDMQRLFAQDTPWTNPWVERVLPNVCDLVARHPARTVFTRFIPVDRVEKAEGAWRRYYEHWSSMTLENLGREQVALLPELNRFVPPARVLNKRVYSPWFGTELHYWLRSTSIDTLVISGGETDVCVLSTVLGAVDLGYRVVIVEDALCSSSDSTHEASLALYEERFGQQIETATTKTVLNQWGA